MSTTIDQKVVEMRFDNKQFESNVATSLSTLDKLKQKLNMSGAAKGFEEVSAAAGRVNMSGLGSAVESVQAKFSALGVMAVTALANITNSAVNAGKKIVSALTIEPIKMGFQEYETQINAVQTILANTSHAGTDLQDVNKALDELNTYADKTIYNFTQMTKNIGTFTAAGLSLEDSTMAIKGIANLAAVSGSTSQQASTAMYQLSQALANGTVNLQDWNSVVNAGMGGKVFQDALVRTAAAMQGVTEETFRANNITGSFRESISSRDGTSWLTAEVLSKTLQQFTGDLSDAELAAQGFTDQQIKDIQTMAETANDAATKVKTFTQLWDTLKESAQSGWTQSWEIIIGDFEEAKEFLTTISDTIGGMLNESAKARNEVLSGALSSGWKQLLGQGISDEGAYIDSIKEIAKEHGVAIDQMIEDEGSFEAALKKGLSEGTITSDMLSESVTNLADKIRNMSDEERSAAGYTDEHVKSLEKLEQGLKDGSISMDEYAQKITELSGREKLIKSLENAFQGVMNVIKPIKEAFSEVFPPITSERITEIIDNIQALTERFKTSTSEIAPQVQNIAKGIFSAFDIVRKIIVNIMDAITDLANSDGIKSLGTLLLDTAESIANFFTDLNSSFETGNLSEFLSDTVSKISDVIGIAVDKINEFESVAETVKNIAITIGDAITNGITKGWDILKQFAEWFTNTFSAGDIFAGLAGGGIFMAMKDFSGFLDTITNTIDNFFKKDSGISKWKDVFVESMNAVHDCLQAFTTGLKIWSIAGIAASISLLASALEKISTISVPDIAKSLTAIGIMIGALVLTLRSMTNILANFKPTGLFKAAASMILIAEAVNVLADAIEKIGKLKLEEIGKGLLGVGGGLLALTKALKAINGVDISLKTSVAMIALAESCVKLGDAMQLFSGLSWDEIGRGLVSMGGALAEFVAALSIMNKFTGGNSIFGSIGLLIAVESLDEIAAALKNLSQMSWEEIDRGLYAMGGALTELAFVLSATGKIAGFSSVFAAGSILGTVQGLDDLASALKKFGEISWEEVDRGLYAMGGALTELGIVLGAVGKITGLSSVFASGAIWITIQGLEDLANAFQKFGSMSWGEIGRGLVGMGGALTELGAVSGALGYLTGIAGVIGAGTIWVAVQGLDELANAFQKFGSMSWSEIGRGLVAMGGALTELGVVSGALGYLTGIAGVVGAGTITLAVQGLDELAEALKKFGEMSWDEIGRGLSAMGGALAEVALGSLLNTFSAIGALSITEVSESLGVLADSVKKWAGVTVPEGLAKQLDELADGIEKFTFAGIGANALNESAEAVGVLAESAKKWSDVTIPDNLKDMFDTIADGIEKFIFAGVGSGSLNESAAAVGVLADSVKKWSGVTVPENLEADMKAVAGGVKAFTFAFTGGWSMGSLVEPLGNLAGAVAKWKDVTIPTTVETDLTAIANGVKAFSFAFLGGWSIDSIINPLKELPGAVAAWEGVILPEGIEENLKSLAAGVQAFAFAFTSGFSMSALVQPLADLPASIKLWSDVTFPEGLGDNLKDLAAGIQPFANVGDISNVANSVTSIAGAVKNLSGIDYQSVTSGITGVYNALKTFTSSQSIIESIYTLSDTFVKAFKDAGSKAVDEVEDMVDNMINHIEKRYSEFESAGEDLVDEVVDGIENSESTLTSTVKSVVSAAASAIEDYYSDFYSAGSYLVTGFANGITANTFAATAAAAAMASAALAAAEAALDENSPSKEAYRIGDFFGVGFVNAISDYKSISYSAGYSMADSAKDGLNNAVSKISRILDSEMNMQPTIRPVLDLSDIRSGTASIGSMLSFGSSIGVMSNISSINTMMNRRVQNGANDDVVMAIRDLKKVLGNISGDTYQFGDITYDDGSNISDTVQKLVRAAKVGRRK